MNNDLPDRSRNILVGILTVSGLVVVVTIAILGVFILARSTSTSNGSSAAPYAVSARTIPATNATVAQIFPTTLGTFTRKTSVGSLSGSGSANISATYTANNGANTITVRAARLNNVSQAKSALQSEAGKIGPNMRIESPSVEFAWMQLTLPDKSVRLLYQNSYWFWDVTANNAAALDSFMGAFKY